MNICFYADHPYWGGLQNNGGSRTILLSAEVLRKLGHEVTIVACVDRFTWFPHPPVKCYVPKNTDVIIAISISDVKEIYKKFPKKKLAYWARPTEITTKSQKWQISKEKAIKRLRKFVSKYNGIVLCNNGWQVDWMTDNDIPSYLIYSGQDLDYKDYLPDYDRTFKLTIGCQYSTKPRKGWKKFKKLAKRLGDKYEYVAFGSEKCEESFLSKYLKNPERKKLNELYRGMDIFVCFSKHEGFFNPGLEASIQGCLLLCNDNPSNGVMDYCNAETAHIVKDLDEAVEAIENPDFFKVVKCQKLIREKVGTREDNMKLMVEVLK